MRILLTGRTGQVGSALERTLAPLGEVIAFDHAGLDLLDAGAVARKVAVLNPAVIVNAAAYTAVDRAESEPDRAFAVNAAGAGALAQAARGIDALLVHYSTDYVFDGEKKSPYVETDAPAPLSVYGRSKLEGERLIAASGCRYLIFRTSWVYSPQGRNFLLAILAAARSKTQVRVVDDQHGAPTSSAAIASATARVLKSLSESQPPNGVYHLSAAGQTTWHGFAVTILESAGLKTPIVPLRSNEYPAAAKRPRNSLLDNAKLAATFGIALGDWREDVPAVVAAVR